MHERQKGAWIHFYQFIQFYTGSLYIKFSNKCYLGLFLKSILVKSTKILCAFNPSVFKAIPLLASNSVYLH